MSMKGIISYSLNQQDNSFWYNKFIYIIQAWQSLPEYGNSLFVVKVSETVF